MSLLQIEIDGSSEEDFLKFSQQLATPSSGSQRLFNYFPAGSINSNLYSLEDTDEDFESAHTPKLMTEEENSAVLNYENIIEYEELTPKAPIYTIEDPVSWQEISAADRFYEDKETDKVLDAQSLKTESPAKSDSKFRYLEEELQIWRSECERYESQNQQLRSEIQLVTNDFLDMEQSYKYQTPELLRLIDKQRYQDEEILKIYDFVEEISQEDGVPKTSRANKADGHVYNHIASKLEIIRSRMHRYRAKNEKLQFDVERITDELKNSHRLIEELSVKLEEKNNSRFESEKDAMIAELTQRLQNKEKTVSQLENQVQILKLGSDRNHSSRQSFTTDGSLTARQPGTFDSDNEGMGTRRPLVDSNINNVRAYEHFNYNDVLKDLREITSRASKALDQRNSIRSSHNANKTNQPHSASPFVKKDTPVKVQPRRMRDETIKKPSFPKYQEYEELKRKYGGFSNMSPIHR